MPEDVIKLMHTSMEGVYIDRGDVSELPTDCIVGDVFKKDGVRYIKTKDGWDVLGGAAIEGPYNSTADIPQPYLPEVAYIVHTGQSDADGSEVYNVYTTGPDAQLHPLGGTDSDGYTKFEVDLKDMQTLTKANNYADGLPKPDVTKTYVDIGDGNALFNAKDYTDEVSAEKADKYYDIIDSAESIGFMYINPGADYNGYSIVFPDPIDVHDVTGDDFSFLLFTQNYSVNVYVTVTDGKFGMYMTGGGFGYMDIYTDGNLSPLIPSYKFIPDPADNEVNIYNMAASVDFPNIPGTWYNQISFQRPIREQGEVTIKYLFDRKVKVDGKTVFGDGVDTELTSPRQGLQKAGPYATVDDIPTPYSDLLIYVVGAASPYAEYMLVSDTLVEVGSTDVDLSDYYKKEETDAKYQPALTAGNNITIANNTISSFQGYVDAPIETITTDVEFNAMLAEIPQNSDYYFSWTVVEGVLTGGNPPKTGEQYLFHVHRGNNVFTVTAISIQMSSNYDRLIYRNTPGYNYGTTGWDYVYTPVKVDGSTVFGDGVNTPLSATPSEAGIPVVKDTGTGNGTQTAWPLTGRPIELLFLMLEVTDTVSFLKESDYTVTVDKQLVFNVAPPNGSNWEFVYTVLESITYEAASEKYVNDRDAEMLAQANAYADDLLPFEAEGWELIWDGAATDLGTAHLLIKPITDFSEIMVCACETRYHSGLATTVVPVVGYSQSPALSGDLGIEWDSVDVMIVNNGTTELFSAQITFPSAEYFMSKVASDVSYVNAIYGKKNYSGGGAGGGIPDAPADGRIYARKDGAWVEVINGSGNTKPDYDNVETTNRITANNGTWTVDRDGYVLAGLQTGNGYVTVEINGIVVFRVDNPSDFQSSPCVTVCEVSVGDIVKLYYTGANATAANHVLCYFIPPKSNDDVLATKADRFTTGTMEDKTFYELVVGDKINGEIIIPQTMRVMAGTQRGQIVCMTFDDPGVTMGRHSMYVNHQEYYDQMYFVDERTGETTYFFDKNIQSTSLISSFKLPDYCGVIDFVSTTMFGGVWADGFSATGVGTIRNMNLIDVYNSCPFPVNAVFMTMDNANPSTYWPGTIWEQFVSGRYIKTPNTFDEPGVLGGADNTTLLSDNIPQHVHSVPRHNHVANNHYHNLYAGWGTGSSADAIAAGPIGNVAYKPAGNGGVNFVQSSGVGINYQEAFDTEPNLSAITPVNIAPTFITVQMWKRIA